MQAIKFLIITFLSLILIACGSNSEQKKKDFSITTNAKKNVLSINDDLILSIKNPKEHKIDSVTYVMNGVRIENKTNLRHQKLGKQRIDATVYYNGGSQNIFEIITLLNDKAPKVFSFTIINEYPHDITSYTQGLEFYKGELYESTGQHGESKIRKLDYRTAEVKNNIDLAKQYFGEGMTVFNDQIYQLTWQGGVGFVYDVNSFSRKSSFKYGQSKEGWGLCNDNKVLYKSDGTEKIWILDPDTLVEKNYIQAYTNKGKIVGLNELEWVEGKIYANRYQKNGVAIINPENGAIEGVIDFSALIKKVKQHAKLDVLNGIAYNPETKTIFVTGKNWNKMFEVVITN
jgi:glutamine cyclotransferase